MNRQKITAIAAIQTSSQNEAIIARKDRGISAPGDLQGKKIGVVRGTTSDFFADSFLLVHGIDREHVAFIHMKPDEMSDSLFEDSKQSQFTALKRAINCSQTTFLIRF